MLVINYDLNYVSVNMQDVKVLRIQKKELFSKCVNFYWKKYNHWKCNWIVIVNYENMKDIFHPYDFNYDFQWKQTVKCVS